MPLKNNEGVKSKIFLSLLSWTSEINSCFKMGLNQILFSLLFPLCVPIAAISLVQDRQLWHVWYSDWHQKRSAYGMKYWKLCKEWDWWINLTKFLLAEPETVAKSSTKEEMFEETHRKQILDRLFGTFDVKMWKK